MSTQAIPRIPPRPIPTHDQAFPKSVGDGQRSDLPKIPPRPASRRPDRSVSPQRDSFARSPLNEPNFVASFGTSPGSRNLNGNALGIDLPRRPPSVTLPSLGQEGSEYAEILLTALESDPSPPQTRSSITDLHLHAPKPSLSASGAKQRVSLVTRTDSTQAAALGIGKANSDDKEPHTRSLKAKASNLSQASTGTERPTTASSDNEHGIPEIGQRVPMCPNAGDVQAPSPSPSLSQHGTSPIFINDSSRMRHHGRRTSARGFEGPPGSYGLHGHGIIPKDRFEQAYYGKHPDLLQKEIGQYTGSLGEGRAQWALSSEDLNKIVRETASKGAGLGTSPTIMATPSEQIGFLASEEYASRISSPKPQTDGSQKYTEVPHTSKDGEVVHVEASESHIHAIYGDAAHVQSTDSLGPNTGTPGEEGGSCDEYGYTAPILASDEVAKDPSVCELQPAVLPVVERRGSTSADPFGQSRSESGSLPSSRPTSRPASIHGVSVVRYPPEIDREPHYTLLEDLDEYEPLFPEDSSGLRDQKATVREDLNRHKLKNRKFPSQDVWEDAPTSLYYTATVSTPQLPLEESERETNIKLQVREGDSPEQASPRRQEEPAEQATRDSNSFLNQGKNSWPHRKNSAEVKPGMRQRFPSRDVWEDSPGSLLLETTVGKPQEDDIASPLDGGPSPVVSHQESMASGVSLGHEVQPTSGASAMAKPHIPARPSKQKHLEKIRPDAPPTDQSTPSTSAANEKAVGSPSASKPAIPERSKPQVPARPAKLISKESSENVHLAKVDSASSPKSIGPHDNPLGSATVTKPKPPVPSRSLGGKIAALQGGFLSDLNKRLQSGPQAVKKEELVQEEEEKKTPLVDARKGRARGPARRAPTKSPRPDAVSAPSLPSSLSFTKPSILWCIHPEDGTVDVPETVYGVSTTKDLESPVPPPATSTSDQDQDESVEGDLTRASHLPVDNAGDDMASSTITVTPDVPTPKKEVETSKTVINMDSGVGNESFTAGKGENLVEHSG